MADDTTRTTPAERPFRWPGKSREASVRFARGETWAAVVEALGVHKKTVVVWHKHPEFRAEVERLKGEIVEALKRDGIASKWQRIAVYDERWRALRQVIAERAADESAQEAAGADTGMLVRTYKALGSGEFMRVVEEYAVDTGLLKELRELEKQAAIEASQWTERKEITGADGKDLVPLEALRAMFLAGTESESNGTA